VSKTGRETQKRFIQHCLHIFRQALLKNYGMNGLVFDPLTTDGFNFDKFAAFIHEGNIIPIREALEEAFIHVSRNGNPKLIWTDLSLDLTRLIHKKASWVATNLMRLNRQIIDIVVHKNQVKSLQISKLHKFLAKNLRKSLLRRRLNPTSSNS